MAVVELDLAAVRGDVEGQADVYLTDATRQLLLDAGWTPPKGQELRFATGGRVAITKPLIVGEQGPELRDLAPGTTIHPQPEATDG